MCRCLCAVVGAPHDCTSERSIILTITGNSWVDDGHEIEMCGSCADAWQAAKAHRILDRRVSLEPELTANGRRA